MSMRELSVDAAAPGARRARGLAAALLRMASRALDGLASRLAVVEGSASGDLPLLEYHADAGAPEGALYVNGQLVGHLLGVSRL